MRRALIAALVLLTPSVVFAAPYIEFAPDYSQPLLVKPGTTVSQIFAPLNDHLSGIELWISTGGVPATIDVSLQNDAGTVVAARTVSLGAIPDSTGGTRTMISLPEQIAVNGSKPYRLNLTPVDASVILYFSSSVSIVPGSGTAGGATYQYGVAVVDGLDQGYSFKYALDETTERTAPVPSNITILQPSIGQAMLEFNASEPVDVQVAYGPNTVAWTGQYSPCLPSIVTCDVFLDVVPGTAYAYTATIKDDWSNSTVMQGVFTAVGEGPTLNTPTPTPVQSTTPTPTPTLTSSPTATPTPTLVNDKTPPVIINPRLVGLTPTSATVAWTTDEAANSLAVILTLGKAASDPTLELEHYLSIGGLLPDHYYRMRVSSSDFWGNYADVLLIFTTPRLSTPTPTVTAPPPGTSVPPVTPTTTPTPIFTVITSPGPLPPPTVPPSSSVNPTATPTSIPTAIPSGSSSPGATEIASETPTPTAVAYPATSTQPGEISWPAATGNVNGYRVDIFDGNNVLLKTVVVNANATSALLPAGLPANVRIIIYADRGGGAFEKISAPITVSERPATSAVTFKAPSVPVMAGAAVLLTALIGAWIWQRRKQHIAATTPLPPTPGIPPAPGTAMPS